MNEVVRKEQEQKLLEIEFNMKENDKNPHIDHAEQMRAFGWRINRHGQWSMDAYEFIKRNEEIRKSLSDHLFMDDIDIVLAPPSVLDRALRNCLDMDWEIKHGKK